MIFSSIYHASCNNIRILVVGAGGTGSHLVHKLAMINQQVELMTDKSIKVCVCDFDMVEKHNCGRQLFNLATDVGMNKATCLVETVNDMYNCDFIGYPIAYNSETRIEISRKFSPDMVILAVDSVKARLNILNDHSYSYFYMDIGNGDTYGQIMLYDSRTYLNNSMIPDAERSKGYVDIIDLYENIDIEKKLTEGASCSAVESLTRQNVMINATMATVAANMVQHLIFNHGTTIQRIFVNNETMEVTPEHIPE